MFFRKKKKAERELFDVSIFASGTAGEDTFMRWTDELMDTAGNVLSADWIHSEEADRDEIDGICSQFPSVDPAQPFFVISPAESGGDDVLLATNDMRDAQAFFRAAEDREAGRRPFDV
ncbi:MULTISPECIES: hypothetical protein [Sporosarcina]|uniref:hypothetical protein n=1 Tax=Sporosarcina TaxID=1569 RepID=UPI00058C1BB6|nr:MULTISPECIES: hypothetical protein [Sporosarcina]WJY26082.1 hypothetical protein QWT68_08265 [Sporosarcina sp. 0.2-SM1T-5]